MKSIGIKVKISLLFITNALTGCIDNKNHHDVEQVFRELNSEATEIIDIAAEKEVTVDTYKISYLKGDNTEHSSYLLFYKKSKKWRLSD